LTKLKLLATSYIMMLGDKLCAYSVSDIIKNNIWSLL